jgi:hypothetical protein
MGDRVIVALCVLLAILVGAQVWLFGLRSGRRDECAKATCRSGLRPRMIESEWCVCVEEAR